MKTHVAVLGSLGPCTEVGLLSLLSWFIGMAKMRFARRENACGFCWAVCNMSDSVVSDS